MGVGTDGHDRSTGAKLTGTAASPQLGRAGGTGRDGQKNVSLFRRIFLLNAAGLTVAAALLLGPVTVSTPRYVDDQRRRPRRTSGQPDPTACRHLTIPRPTVFGRYGRARTWTCTEGKELIPWPKD